MSKSNREIYYYIKLIPNNNIFASGEDPAGLLKEIQDMGQCEIHIHTKDIPQLYEYAPKNCYFFWHIVLKEPALLTEIEEKLNLFRDSCSYSIEKSDGRPTAVSTPRPQKLGNVKIRNKSRVPQLLDEELKKIQRIRESDYTLETQMETSGNQAPEKKRKRTTQAELKKVISTISNIRKSSNVPIEELIETTNKLLALNDSFKSTGLGDADWNEDLIEFVLDNDRLIKKLQKQVENIRENIGNQNGKESVSPYEIWKIVHDNKKE